MALRALRSGTHIAIQKLEIGMPYTTWEDVRVLDAEQAETLAANLIQAAFDARKVRDEELAGRLIEIDATIDSLREEKNRIQVQIGKLPIKVGPVQIAKSPPVDVRESIAVTEARPVGPGRESWGCFTV